MVISLAACGTQKAPETQANAVSFQVVVTDMEGHESQYGLYIDCVNGIAADWDNDQTYWAFYVNGEYAVTGIDTTEIVADTVYGLTLTKG